MATISALDVARYVLEKQGEMTAMKLQKLVYYAQAWSLVWDESPLFKEKIEAWFNGPVVRALYNKHRGQFKISQSSFQYGDASKPNETQKETIDAVLKYYSKYTAQQLSELTHKEQPWIEARTKAGLAFGERGNEEITHASMAEYYGSLQ